MKKIENSECLKAFGAFIKDGREYRDMYQAEVAKLVGVSQSYYSEIENGKKNVDLVMAMKICQILRLDLNEYIERYMK